MTPPPPLFHALLRPAVLQILRATGYHSAKTSVLDSVTDLAARYFLNLCHLTAVYATHNNTLGTIDDTDLLQPLALPASGQENQEPIPASTATTAVATASSSSSSAPTLSPVVPAPTIVDVRMALQRAGALLPEHIIEEQEYLGEEDTRGVEGFLAWATGALNREITRIALDGNDEAGDYLDGRLGLTSVVKFPFVRRQCFADSVAALKKKHSKNDDDSKYLGTLLGRSIEYGDVVVEGGECPSIFEWEERRRLAGQRTPEPLSRLNGLTNGHGLSNGDGDGDGEDSRPPSSGLSSLGDRSIADEMDLS